MTEILETRRLFSDQFRYVCGPFIAMAANGDWLLTFNMSVRREVGPYSPRPWLHPPNDPEYCNYMMRSKDQGRTWGAPHVLPGYEWRGMEHAALCLLRNGEILASHYQRVFFPLENAQKHKDRFGWNHRPPAPLGGDPWRHLCAPLKRPWPHLGGYRRDRFISLYQCL